MGVDQWMVPRPSTTLHAFPRQVAQRAPKRLVLFSKPHAESRSRKALTGPYARRVGPDSREAPTSHQPPGVLSGCPVDGVVGVGSLARGGCVHRVGPPVRRSHHGASWSSYGIDRSDRRGV